MAKSTKNSILKKISSTKKIPFSSISYPKSVLVTMDSKLLYFPFFIRLGQENLRCPPK